jgi:hypothetical protein
MPKITVYRYRLFDASSGSWMESRSSATRRGIDAAGGQIIEGSAEEVDIDRLNNDGILVRGPEPDELKPKRQ